MLALGGDQPRRVAAQRQLEVVTVRSEGGSGAPGVLSAMFCQVLARSLGVECAARHVRHREAQVGRGDSREGWRELALEGIGGLCSGIRQRCTVNRAEILEGVDRGGVPWVQAAQKALA